MEHRLTLGLSADEYDRLNHHLEEEIPFAQDGEAGEWELDAHPHRIDVFVIQMQGEAPYLDATLMVGGAEDEGEPAEGAQIAYTLARPLVIDYGGDRYIVRIRRGL